MSEIEGVKVERDAIDGGFAVVDRERLIEEETRVVTPWYKHFINSLVAPTKMMEECFALEPVKGASVGVVGIMLFTIITLWITNLNPLLRQAAYDGLRKGGVAEDMIHQQYMVNLIVGGIVGIIGIFLVALVQCVVLQIIKSIAKDKCRFASLYTMLIVCCNISLGMQVIDQLLAYLMGMDHVILNMGSFFKVEVLEASPQLAVLLRSLSIESILGLIYMIIGYRTITHVSTKKATVICVIFNALWIIVGLLLV